MAFWAVAGPIIASVLGGLASRTRQPMQFAQLPSTGGDFAKISADMTAATLENLSRHQKKQEDSNAQIEVKPLEQYKGPQGGLSSDFALPQGAINIQQPPPKIPEPAPPTPKPPPAPSAPAAAQTGVWAPPPEQNQTPWQEEPTLADTIKREQGAAVRDAPAMGPYSSPRKVESLPLNPEAGNQKVVLGPEDNQYQGQPKQSATGLTGVELAMLGAQLASGLFARRPGPAPPSLPGGGGINMKPVFWGG